jgi:hypothetical protein
MMRTCVIGFCATRKRKRAFVVSPRLVVLRSRRRFTIAERADRFDTVGESVETEASLATERRSGRVQRRVCLV